jgi:hypothetical protein
MNEVKRKQRLEEVTDELCGYRWYGNEEDKDYKMEYSMEYSHLLKEKEELEELNCKTQTLVFNGTSYQFSPYYPNGEENYGIYINEELEPTYQLHPYSLENWGVQFRLCSHCGNLSYTLKTIYFGEELSFQNITECIEKIEKFTNTKRKSFV